MNLFTYLMSKKGYNYLPHQDLFAYLLGKSNSIPNISSGTEITINSRKGVLISLELDKESTQGANPTPTDPQEINTITTSITITVSDSENNVKTKTIPLGNNEIAGIGDKKDKLIIDKNGHCYLQKNTRKLELPISNMNNAADYPGWQALTQLKHDYNNKNGYFKSYANYLSNISNYAYNIGINTAGNGVLYLSKASFGLTQAQWKEQYPDLVFKIIYDLQEPELVDLDYTIDMSIFKGNNTITNDKNAYMQIQYF